MIDIPVLIRFACGANPKPLSTKKAVDVPLKRVAAKSYFFSSDVRIFKAMHFFVQKEKLKK